MLTDISNAEIAANLKGSGNGSPTNFFVPIELAIAHAGDDWPEGATDLASIATALGPPLPAHHPRHFNLNNATTSRYKLRKGEREFSYGFIIREYLRTIPCTVTYSTVDTVNVIVFHVDIPVSFDALKALPLAAQDNMYGNHAQVPVVVMAYNPLGLAQERWKVKSWDAYNWASSKGYHYLELNMKDEDSKRAVRDTLVLRGADRVLRTMRRNAIMEKLSERERVAQAREAERLRDKGRLTQFYRKMFSFLFDLFQVVLACMDVTTDIWVAVQYWQANQPTFFYIALADLILAQISYTIFFVIFYSENKGWRTQLVAFLVIFPFGQLIPLIIYVHSFHFAFVDRIFDYFGLEGEITYQADGEDPLRVYLKQKLVAHAGFYLESLVEAIPQSILQMVAIVITGQVTAVNVVSLVLSISSVGAKGLMMSYSIHRPTAVFSFCCILFDVFSVFTITSWLFFKSPTESNFISVFYINTPQEIFSGIWFWKQGIFVIVCGFGALLAFVAILTDLNPCGDLHSKPRQSAIAVGVFLAGTGLFLPIMIVMEGMKLAFIPLLVFQSIDSPHGRQMPFYSRLFAFLRGSDFKERAHAANHALAVHFQMIHNRPQWQPEVNRRGQPLPQRKPRYIMQQENHYRTSDYVLQTSPEDFTLNGLRKAARYSIEGILDFAKDVAAKENDIQTWHQYLTDLAFRYLFFITFPIWFLSGAYSMFYPFLRLFTLDSNVSAPLQRALTWVLIALLIIILLLLRSVRRFRQSVFYTMVYDFYGVDLLYMDWIENAYAVFQERRRVIQALGGTVPPDHSIVDLPLIYHGRDEVEQVLFEDTEGDNNNHRGPGVVAAHRKLAIQRDEFGVGTASEPPSILPPEPFVPPPPEITVADEYPGDESAIRLDTLQPLPVKRNVPPISIDTNLPVMDGTARLSPVAHSPSMILPKSPLATLNEEETWMHFGVLPFVHELLGRVPALAALPTPLGHQLAFNEFHHEHHEGGPRTPNAARPHPIEVPDAGAGLGMPGYGGPRSNRSGGGRTPGGGRYPKPAWVDDGEEGAGLLAGREEGAGAGAALDTNARDSLPAGRQDE